MSQDGFLRQSSRRMFDLKKHSVMTDIEQNGRDPLHLIDRDGLTSSEFELKNKDISRGRSRTNLDMHKPNKNTTMAGFDETKTILVRSSISNGIGSFVNGMPERKNLADSTLFEEDNSMGNMFNASKDTKREGLPNVMASDAKSSNRKLSGQNSLVRMSPNTKLIGNPSFML
jgi:hypothetical protein